MAAVADSPGFDWVSSVTRRSGRPRTPPAALRSSKAIMVRWLEDWPRLASLPVREANWPILMGSCAARVKAKQSAATAEAKRKREGEGIGRR